MIQNEIEARVKQLVAGHPSLRLAARWTRLLMAGPSGLKPTNGRKENYERERLLRLVTDPFFAPDLQAIDEQLRHGGPVDAPALFAKIPFDLFALLAFERPQQYPHIGSYFPGMPAEELQKEWVGTAGIPLMRESAAFIRALCDKQGRFGQKPLSDCTVLDYGCGWGRMLRLMLKFVPESQLWGYDAWEHIVTMAKSLGVRGQLQTVPEYPEQLPGPKFDLIYLFSIFTHLSERCHRAVLQALHTSLADSGILVLTVRPLRFWDQSKNPRAEELKRTAQERGFAFDPHPKLTADASGEVPYGDTTISPSYIAANWTQFELLDVDTQATMPEQVILTLRKRLL